MRERITGSAAALVLALAAGAGAQESAWNVYRVTWNGSASASWADAANWDGGAVPNYRFAVARFSDAGNGRPTVTVNSPQIEHILFDTAGAAAYTIGSGGAGTQSIDLNTNARGGIRVSSSVISNQRLDANIMLGFSGVTSGTGNIIQRSPGSVLTLAGGIWSSAASGAKTLNVISIGDTVIRGVIANNGGSGTATVALTKAGGGTLTLTNTNTYTGVTAVNGGTLCLNRQTGSLSSGTALTFGGAGTFNLDNAGASGALSQSLGTLTFSTGEGTVKTTRTADFDEAVTFSSLAARAAGAAGNFVCGGGVNGADNGFVLTGRAAGFIDRGVFCGGADYASMDALGTYVRALAYGTDPNTEIVGTITAGRHVKLTATPPGQNTISLLTLNLSGAVDWTQNAGQTLTVPGLLKSGGGLGTLSGGAALTGGAELVIRTDTASDFLAINTPITGAFALTKSGAGTLTLNAASTYSGATAVNAGSLAYGVDNAISTGAVTINGGVFDLGTFSDTVGAVTLAAGSIAGSGTLTGSSYTMNGPGDTSVSAALGGTAGLVKSNHGTLTLTGASTYTGITTVQDGALVVSRLADGGSPSSIGASSSAAGNLYFQANDAKFPATLRYIGPAADTDRLLRIARYSSAAIEASGTGALRFTNSGTLQIDGTNYDTSLELGGSSTNDNTFTPVIPGTVAVYLAKTGAGKWILAGANAYTGQTTIKDGTLALSGAGTLGAASGRLALAGGALDLGTLSLAKGAVAITAAARSGETIRNGSLTGTSYAASLASGDAIVSANLLGSGGVTKSGAGTLTLSGNNTYTGATAVNGGTLRAGAASVAGVSGAFGLNSAVTLANAANVRLHLDGFDTRIGSLAGGGTAGGAVDLGRATLTAGSNNASTSFAGAISGAGGLAKVGSGTLTLSGAATHRIGFLRAEGGTLKINTPSLGEDVAVYLTTGAVLNLNYSGTNEIRSLYIDGGPQSAGTWGGTASSAAHKTGLITGAGLLNVVPSAGPLLLIR